MKLVLVSIIVQERFFFNFLCRMLLNLICLKHKFATLDYAMVALPKIGDFNLWRSKLAYLGLFGDCIAQFCAVFDFRCYGVLFSGGLKDTWC